MKFVEKPWGYEKIQELDNIVLKELYMKASHRCSLQLHEKKNEILYLLSGKLKLSITSDINVPLTDIILNPGDCYSIPCGLIHRMEAIDDSIYIESSTNNLTDIIRFEDSYGRI